MQTKKVKNVAFQKRLTYKVSFDKFTDSSFYGVTNHRFGFIVINTDKSKPMQIYTLIHERIHEIIEKFSRNEIREKLHGLHDLIDYFVSDFKVSYTEFIRFKGFKWYANKIINRYLTERNEDIYNKIQLRLSDFSEFAEIVKQHDKDVHELRVYHVKLTVNYIAQELKLRKIKVEIGNFPDKLFCSKILGIIYMDKSYLSLNCDLLRLMLTHELNHIKIYRLLRNNPKIESKMQDLEDKNIVRVFEQIKAKNESKPQNQTDLRRFCEKRNN